MRNAIRSAPRPGGNGGDAFYDGPGEDATRFGPQHVRSVMVQIDDRPVLTKRIVYTQAKNEHRNPVHLDIPLHPELEL